MATNLPPLATGPSVWTRAEMEKDRSWIIRFSDADLAELEAATALLHERGIPPEEFSREDFPLPGLGPKFGKLLEEIEYGRGFALLKGLNLAQYDLDKLSILFWGLGTHLGEIISQNTQGDLLGRVTDYETGKFGSGGYYEAGIRGHRTNAYLPPHSDSSDVVGLLCGSPGARRRRKLDRLVYGRLQPHS